MSFDNPAWCPECDCEVIPRRNGTCGFCDADTDTYQPPPQPEASRIPMFDTDTIISGLPSGVFVP